MPETSERDRPRTTSFRFPEEIHDRLQKASDDSGLSKTRLLILLVRDHIEKTVTRYRIT